MTIAIFKTNINCPDRAKHLIVQIHNSFGSCKANFDLDDCDKILRVVSINDDITITNFIHWLKKMIALQKFYLIIK